MRQLDSIAGVQVWEDEARNQVVFIAGMEIDADGSPFAYAPKNSGLPALDSLGNAKDQHGNWVGIATDDHGVPYIQTTKHPAPGYYVSTTSLQFKEFGKGDPKRYCDSGNIKFIVLPGGHFNKWGVVLGASCTVEHVVTGDIFPAVFADVGPSNKIGEGSIRLAESFGVNTDARRGGESRKLFRYKIDRELALNL